MPHGDKEQGAGIRCTCAERAPVPVRRLPRAGRRMVAGWRSDTHKMHAPNTQLRKLALQRCELELLRSHPKDERGSMREIGLCVRMEPTLHFLELSLTVCSFLACC